MTAALAIAPEPWTMPDAMFPAQIRPAATLNNAILSACERLESRSAVDCIVCGGAMEPRSSAVGVSGGRCRDCGSILG